MTLYFNTLSPFEAKFTVNIANASTYTGIWTMSLRSELTHTSPVLQSESQVGMDLSIDVVSSNERSTTFQFSNNYAWADMKNNFKDGIYVYQIGLKTEGEEIIFTPVISGVAKVITGAGENPNRNIVSYQSNNEDNSGFVYYSENL